MDPKHAAEVLRHLEKESASLRDAHKQMSHELHRLQVEEEMLMRKFYELMTATASTKRIEGGTTAAFDGESGQSDALTHVKNEGE
ncbi:hypothetical protein Ancab_025910 [Ancistrocladus abbreviatus]